MDLNQLDIFPPDVIRVEKDGIDLLGAPLGSNDFANKIVIERVEKISRAMDLLDNLNHPQYQLLLLRYCVGMPRFGYSLRTADPEAISEAIRLFDEKVDEVLFKIIGKGLDKKRRALAGLPVRMGGLGIPRAADIAASAFLGSLVDTKELQMAVCQETAALDDALDHYIDIYNNTHPTVPRVCPNSIILEIGKSQSHLTEQVHEDTLNRLKEWKEPSFKATILGCMAERSGKWTDLFPNKHRGLFMPAVAFSAALKYRLGLDIFNSQNKCSKCSRMVDTRGHHIATCPSIHVGHHNNIRNLIRDEAARAHLQPVLEPTGLLFGSDRDHERPADVMIPDYKGGMTLCLDVTIVDSFGHLDQVIAPPHGEEPKPGFNAKRAADLKMKKYENIVKDHGMTFLPFAMESLGGLDQNCHQILTHIGSKLAEIDKTTKEAATNRFHDKIVFTWMRNLGISLAYHAQNMSQEDFI
jgi:hypothetical protein